LNDNTVILRVFFHNRRPGKPTGDAIERGFNNNIWDLMQDCWKKLPDDRPPMEVVLAELTKLRDTSESDEEEEDDDDDEEDEEDEEEPRQVRAQYSYDSRGVGHLPLTEGMSLEVLDERDPE
jgi:hypothetical protein